MRGSGDGFVRCSDGHVRWGRFGAAGAVFVHRGDDGPRVMLQKRSQWAHEGGTWSVAGGALDAGESPDRGCAPRGGRGDRRPSRRTGSWAQYVFAPADDWSYTTIVVEVDEPFGYSTNFETDAVGWFAPGRGRPTWPVTPASSPRGPRCGS